jgi:hypothetical protein
MNIKDISRSTCGVERLGGDYIRRTLAYLAEWLTARINPPDLELINLLSNRRKSVCELGRELLEVALGLGR